ncbi:GNAT family N-acetyltransferase [Candidatus Eisenbacteria bacterium]|uniref:GNAT family N-acetyltransferase n=1 Tax=Eiseniibacteriota bacterium TaxID=2212470 RepID=A0ABV6YJI3_UNCEI
MHEVNIVEQSVADLVDYFSVPISFEVRTILDVRAVDEGWGGFVLTEQQIETPYVKDYDAVQDEPSLEWSQRWDISNWGVLSVFVSSSRVGGCVMAFDTPGIHKLEDRKDVIALWDLRVHPDHRRKGIGAQLFQSAEEWARKRGCRLLRVETQNINVPACRFYRRQGCVLGAIDRYAYAEFPEEVELEWFKEL